MSPFRTTSITLIASLAFTSVALVGVSSGVAQAESACADIAVIGVPGTFQGAQHAQGKTDDNSLLGEQVADAVHAITAELPDVSVTAVSYAAVGASVSDAVDAKLIYDLSTYKKSKDSGYAIAREAVADKAASCPSTKFLLVGYSQGSHISGDLAQSILHGNGPVDASQLAGAFLIADPAYNGSSPRAIEFQYNEGNPDDSTFDSSKDTVFQNNNRWDISGSLGKRQEFTDSDPIVSICVFGDPICDTGATANVANKQWMHGIYGKVNYTDSEPLTTWGGKAVAELAKG